MRREYQLGNCVSRLRIKSWLLEVNNEFWEKDMVIKGVDQSEAEKMNKKREPKLIMAQEMLP